MEMEKIEQLRRLIAESKKIVFFGGAGVSTESNIPDFRSENGLYQARQQYGYSPEEMLSHHFYLENTETFFDYYKNNLIYQEAKPNPAHYALAKLEAEGKLLAVITQNIDGLHQLAGSKKVYELHGSVLRNYCTGCGRFYDLDSVLSLMDKVPYCPHCDQVIKPDVVLYEEPLQEEVIAGAVAAIMQADLLIIGGTSLAVYPAAGFIQYFRGEHLVLINKSATQYDQKAELVIRDAIGEVFAEVMKK